MDRKPRAEPISHPVEEIESIGGKGWLDYRDAARGVRRVDLRIALLHHQISLDAHAFELKEPLIKAFGCAGRVA